jgi:DNA repair protein RecO (recombination protein O)
MPVTYFALWITRLMGWLPDLSRCLLCRASLAGQAAYFHWAADGLFCSQHSEDYGAMLSTDSQILALRIFRSPASAFVAEAWPRSRGADLRCLAIQSLERHLERKLTTATALARLGG